MGSQPWPIHFSITFEKKKLKNCKKPYPMLFFVLCYGLQCANKILWDMRSCTTWIPICGAFPLCIAWESGESLSESWIHPWKQMLPNCKPELLYVSICSFEIYPMILDKSINWKSGEEGMILKTSFHTLLKYWMHHSTLQSGFFSHLFLLIFSWVGWTSSTCKQDKIALNLKYLFVSEKNNGMELKKS